MRDSVTETAPLKSLRADCPEAAPSKNDHCQRGGAPVVRDDGSIEIPLTRGQVAAVDAEDYDLVRGRRWRAFYSHGSWYAQATTYMHRVIMDAPSGIEVDHINHDGLDNRRSNLRFATTRWNHCNARKRTGGASRFKGVCLHKSTGLWRASIWCSGKEVSVGYYRAEESAAQAYDRAAEDEYGEFAFTNLAAGLL